jgi:ketosteroid isomerase-like protein
MLRSFLGLIALAAASAARADVRAEIEAANRAFEAAAAKGDGKALAGLYTATGQALPAGSDVVSGTEAIGKFWQGVLDSGVRACALRP